MAPVVLPVARVGERVAQAVRHVGRAGSLQHVDGVGGAREAQAQLALEEGEEDRRGGSGDRY